VDTFGHIHDFARAYGALCWNLSKVIPRKDLPRIYFDPPGTCSSFSQVLNKVNTFGHIHDFARAYGALCWKLSKVIPRKDLPRIYFDPPGTFSSFSQVLNKVDTFGHIHFDDEKVVLIYLGAQGTFTPPGTFSFPPQVLNKVDTFGHIHDFARAYGALCWNLSKVIPRKDLPRIYTMFLPPHAIGRQSESAAAAMAVKINGYLSIYLSIYIYIPAPRHRQTVGERRCGHGGIDRRIE